MVKLFVFKSLFLVFFLFKFLGKLSFEVTGKQKPSLYPSTLLSCYKYSGKKKNREQNIKLKKNYNLILSFWELKFNSIKYLMYYFVMLECYYIFYFN